MIASLGSLAGLGACNIPEEPLQQTGSTLVVHAVLDAAKLSDHEVIVSRSSNSISDRGQSVLNARVTLSSGFDAEIQATPDQNADGSITYFTGPLILVPGAT